MYKTTPGFASAPSQVFKGSTSAVTHQVFKIISMQIQIHYAACLASDNIRAKLCHLQLRSKFSSTILLSINLSFKHNGRKMFEQCTRFNRVCKAAVFIVLFLQVWKRFCAPNERFGIKRLMLETFITPFLQSCILLFISPGDNQPTCITASLRKGTSTFCLLSFQNSPVD